MAMMTRMLSRSRRRAVAWEAAATALGLAEIYRSGSRDCLKRVLQEACSRCVLLRAGNGAGPGCALHTPNGSLPHQDVAELPGVRRVDVFREQPGPVGEG